MEINSRQHSLDIIAMMKANIFDYIDNIPNLLEILQHIQSICVIRKEDNIIDKVFKLYLSSKSSTAFIKSISDYDLRMITYRDPIRMDVDTAKNILFYFKASDRTLTILAKAKLSKAKNIRDYICDQIDGLIADFDGFDIIEGFTKYLMTNHPEEYVGKFEEYHKTIKYLHGQI